MVLNVATFSDDLSYFLLRCGIPVVVMGETGCGKTRLIRYMCDLARQGMDKRNMMILKVGNIPCSGYCMPDC